MLTTLTLTLLFPNFILPTFQYSPRTTCYYNQGIQTIRYQYFLTILLRSPEQAKYYGILGKYEDCGSHFGRDIEGDIWNITNYLNDYPNTTNPNATIY